SYDIGSGTAALAISANISGLAANTVYYYQAWAWNSAGSASGAIGSFVTSSQVTSPTNLSPADGSTNVSIAPTLTWSPVANATGYGIFLGITNPPPAAGTTAGTSYAPGQLSSNTTYYWKIVATDGSSSASSPTVSFTTTTAQVSAPVLVS